MKRSTLQLTFLSAYLVLTFGVSAGPISISENDWPWWRGPTRDGKAVAGQKVPTTWSNTDNVRWKTKVPGMGHASPTVVGSLILLASADAEKKTQSILAFDRESGKARWSTVVMEGGLPEKIHKNNTHASGTVACDGERAFAIFFNNDAIQIVAVNMAGKKLWQKKAGTFAPRKYEFGYGASPLISGAHVVVAADYEKGGFLVAFDRVTGEEAWRVKRDEMINYSTPVLTTVDGKEQILLGGNLSVTSYEPASGKLLWKAPGPSKATCATLVTDGTRVFSSGGYPEKFTVCVDASGKEHWRNNQKSYEQSMMVHEDHLYTITDAGIAYCWRIKDGKEMWKARLKGPVSASPILVDDIIYQSNEVGTTFVFKADPSGFDLLAENQLENVSFATLSICGNRIYTRVANRSDGAREEWLYCLGE